MSKSWSKEDRYHYGKSEVMQELEKRVISNLHRLDILRKKAQDDSAQNAEALSAALDKATESAKTLKSEVANLAKDDVVAEDALKEGEEEQNRQEVVNDLRDMVQAALDEKNIKLAYKIERTIDEILEQETRCKL